MARLWDPRSDPHQYLRYWTQPCGLRGRVMSSDENGQRKTLAEAVGSAGVRIRFMERDLTLWVRNCVDHSGCERTGWCVCHYVANPSAAFLSTIHGKARAMVKRELLSDDAFVGGLICPHTQRWRGVVGKDTDAEDVYTKSDALLSGFLVPSLAVVTSAIVHDFEDVLYHVAWRGESLGVRVTLDGRSMRLEEWLSRLHCWISAPVCDLFKRVRGDVVACCRAAGYHPPDLLCSTLRPLGPLTPPSQPVRRSHTAAESQRAFPQAQAAAQAPPLPVRRNNTPPDTPHAFPQAQAAVQAQTPPPVPVRRDNTPPDIPHALPQAQAAAHPQTPPSLAICRNDTPPQTPRALLQAQAAAQAQTPPSLPVRRTDTPPERPHFFRPPAQAAPPAEAPTSEPVRRQHIPAEPRFFFPPAQTEAQAPQSPATRTPDCPITTTPPHPLSGTAQILRQLAMIAQTLPPPPPPAPASRDSPAPAHDGRVGDDVTGDAENGEETGAQEGGERARKGLSRAQRRKKARAAAKQHQQQQPQQQGPQQQNAEELDTRHASGHVPARPIATQQESLPAQLQEQFMFQAMPWKQWNDDEMDALYSDEEGDALWAPLFSLLAGDADAASNTSTTNTDVDVPSNTHTQTQTHSTLHPVSSTNTNTTNNHDGLNSDTKPSASPPSDDNKSTGANDDDDDDAEGEEDADGLPYDLVCPVSFALMVDPVVAADGISYAREALVQCIEYAKKNDKELRSPMTGEAMDAVFLPNVDMRRRVLTYMEKHGLKR